MSALARKEDVSSVTQPKTNSSVVPFSGAPAAKRRLRSVGFAVIHNVVPPLIVLALLLAVWQLLCSEAGATLPPPSQVWQESRDLIAHPFFNYGSQDIGLGWRVLIS